MRGIAAEEGLWSDSIAIGASFIDLHFLPFPDIAIPDIEIGDVHSQKIFDAIGGGCDEEALDVVSNMPAWRSARQNGKNVKFYFTLPIVFKM